MTRMAALLASSLLCACGAADQPASTDRAAHGEAQERSAPGEGVPDAAQRTLLETLDESLLAANLENGRRLYRRCSACHTLGDGGPHLVGPNLHGLFGRAVGSESGFGYSQALQDADFIWTPEQLDNWLQSPRSFLPGNRMSFAGLREDADRRDVIAYLAVETQPARAD